MDKKTYGLMYWAYIKLQLHELNSDVAEYFKPHERLSDFQVACVKMVGDIIRPATSQYFWMGGKFCWFDETQSHVNAVYQTECGVLMYEANDGSDEATLYSVFVERISVDNDGAL